MIKKELHIELTKEHDNLISAMDLITRVKESFNWDEIGAIKVFWNQVRYFDISSCIHGFLFDLQNEAGKRNISFIKVKVS